MKEVRVETAEKIAAAMEGRMKNKEFSVERVHKNNGQECTEIFVRECGSRNGALIKVDANTAEAIESGKMTPQEAADRMLELLWEQADEAPNETDVKNCTSKEYILANVKCCLINRKMNQISLGTIPYRGYLDLAVVYRVNINDKYRVTVTNGIMESTGMSLHELNAAAEKNTAGDLTAIAMSKILSENGVDESLIDNSGMVVYTNQKRENGAIAMAYPHLFRKQADAAESDLFILPSSIHEVIAVPTDTATTAELLSMVKTVNTDTVDTEDLLSYSVYRYDRYNDCVSIAAF